MLGVSVWVWVVAVVLGCACVLIIKGGSMRDNPALRPPLRQRQRQDDGPDADAKSSDRRDGKEVDF